MRLLRSAGMLGFLTAVIGAAPAHGQSLCLHLRAEDRSVLYPVTTGGLFGISFLHSIYGTEVRELFRITPTGFQTETLRYAELRLAEFYGHAAAKLEQGWWIVDNPGHDLRQIDIRVGNDAVFWISFDERQVRLAEKPGASEPVRLSVISCGDRSHGR
jgi:hypothetical protein